MSWGMVSFIGVVAISAFMLRSHAHPQPGAVPGAPGFGQSNTIGVCRGR